MGRRPVKMCCLCGRRFVAADQRRRFCSSACRGKVKRRSLADRFWEKVKKGRGCWLWQASFFRDGYGQIRDGRTNRRAHRVAWKLTNGLVPDGLHVLHHCDDPACCNPRHLFLGTAQDNMADKCTKNREARGEKQGLARLTEKKVRQLRRLEGTITRRQLAEKFDISYPTVGDVLRRRTWRHVI